LLHLLTLHRDQIGRTIKMNNKNDANPKDDGKDKYLVFALKIKLKNNTSFRSRDIKCFKC